MSICLILYKIDPHKGSEHATGYHLAKQIVERYPGATLVTQTKYIKALQADPAFRDVRCVGVDVPRGLSVYKRKSRGVILYYYLWQICVGRQVRRMARDTPFTILHQVNFHTDWCPHFLAKARAPVVWGPLVHHPITPFSWFPMRQKHGFIVELLKAAVKRVFWYANPALRRAIRGTDRIVFGNTDVPAIYKELSRQPIGMLPYAGSHWPVPADKARDAKTFHLLFVGRFVALKGPHLALDAFQALLNHVDTRKSTVQPHLTLIGDGPMRDHVRHLAARINAVYPNSVTLRPWVARETLPKQYQDADYFLYPSLESQGLVVSEAMSQLCPAITLSGTGPAFVSRLPGLTVSVKNRSYRTCVAAMACLLKDLYARHASNDVDLRALHEQTLERAKQVTWPAIAKEIMMFYPDHHV